MPQAARNFVYAIVSTAPSPTGRGTILEWLEYYKLGDDVETFVTMDFDGPLPEVGDLLWFQVDDRVVARVPLARVFLDPLREKYELWYRGSDIVRIYGVTTAERGARYISEEASKTWLTRGAPSFTSTA